jgi:ribosome biogenesis GTPase A
MCACHTKKKKTRTSSGLGVGSFGLSSRAAVLYSAESEWRSAEQCSVPLLDTPSLCSCSLMRFRTRFHFTGTVNWFPGHMLKSLRDLTAKLKMCTAVVEVRDARCYLAGSNPSLESLMRAHPKCHRLVFLNKTDLVDASTVRQAVNHFHDRGIPCVAASTFAPACASQVLSLLTAALARSRAAGPTGRRDDSDSVPGTVPSALPVPTVSSSQQAVVAVVGMPNVGKSSLINILRKHAFGTGLCDAYMSPPH